MSLPVRSDVVESHDEKFGARPPKIGRWEPRKWSAVYDQIVILSILNKSNIEIGKLFQYTPQQISNILNCAQAKKLRETIYVKLNKTAVDNTAATLEQISIKAVQRISDVINNDELAAEAPLAIFDKSVAILKGIGKLKDEASAMQVNARNAIIIASSDANRLIDAMQESNKAATALEIVQELPTG